MLHEDQRLERTAPVVPFAAQGHVVVDLSVTVAEDLPCYWEGHQPFQHKTSNWFVDRIDPVAPLHSRGGPYTTRWMAIDEHTGTHFDAPTHFVPPPGSGLPGAGPTGAISAEKVELSTLMGGAAVLDVEHLNAPDGQSEKGVSPLIGADTITAWETRHGRLNAGDIVLFRTGWDTRYRRGREGDGYLRDVLAHKSPAWPAPSVDVVELLLGRGVRCVGIDAPSIGAAHDPIPAHVTGLREAMVFIECLTALDRLPSRGAWFCFLPVKVEGGTGAPGRAVALVPPGTTLSAYGDGGDTPRA
ncbi:cyclase family protein [Streptomyces malaysiensis]|uniref:Cyclase family protein n=1 Tax=Streptomyces malaysiensis subsp. samsunensis TaxID=459658 RepID=A0A9X2RZB2_STRMQ|nr:cyclase family protein [Streptomyces samsunensis]MCQ8836247.1 cyclase family protein [Streptomyces samsunensis]